MRKFLACSIVAFGVFALAACGGGGKKTSTGGGNGGGGLEAFCEEAADSWHTVLQTDSIDVTDDSGLDDAKEKAAKLADVAPDDIKDEANDVKELAEDYVNAIQKAGDDEADREEARADFGQANGERIETVLTKVDDFITEECDAGGGTSDLSDFSDFSDLSDIPSDLSDFECEDFASSYDLPPDYCDSLSDFTDFDFSDFSDFDFSDMLSDLSDFGSGN